MLAGGAASEQDAPARVAEDARRDVVVRTARRLTALGGDVLKCEFPYDAGVTDKARWAEACAELEEACAIPWVILSAGVDDATFEAQTLAACQAGLPLVPLRRLRESSLYFPAKRLLDCAVAVLGLCLLSPVGMAAAAPNPRPSKLSWYCWRRPRGPIPNIRAFFPRASTS